MRKEKIKQLMDVMQAYVNGKTIQYYDVDLSFKIKHPGEPNFNNKWVDVDEEHLFRPDMYDYRVKPEPKYRPFKDADECWQEMLKHEPFGWIKCRGCYFNIVAVTNVYAYLSEADGSAILLASKNSYNDNTFPDGAPFGVKEGV